MADIYLNVPYVTQKNIGGHAGGDTRDDPTGCWYAAVSMLGYYREQGPRLGVPDHYLKPDGSPQKVDKNGNTAALAMGSAGYEQLVVNEGLTAVPLPSDKRWTCRKLAEILRACGPCFVRRGWIKQGKLTGGHAVVLVGARESDSKVVIHDPGSRGANWECTIDEFNAFFKWEGTKAKKYSMMCKLPVLGGLVLQRTSTESSLPTTRPRSNAISH
ncbi:papain-like cysteine protease family protein [Pelagibius sp. Alg239-R121]|uniref:papain-like cysteine protease family protein n=1 Tax=Pelagibius sp. Alg239-R121 TaxID=2993448 RepID=UPI0024A67A48|nr:papain-like cysteine protease family protein [Pelagibius sp. Alg239-R121]